MKKNIAIIGTVGLPANYGGWETLVDHLTREIAHDFDITVFCSSKRYVEKFDSYNGVKLNYIDIDANGIQSIIYDIVSMLKSLRFADTFLILGVSGCVFLPFLRLFSCKNIIVNIDGLEWKRAKWGLFAKWFLKLSESVAVRFAHITISDNKAIQDYVKSKYGKDSVLIAYGADHVRHVELDKPIVETFPFLKKKYVFKVCRIEPENNVNLILKAFENHKAFDLVIVGNWNNSDYGKFLKARYSHFDHIHLIDPIYDQKILNQLRSNCYIYIHGHGAGGTNPSLVEAMYLGLPIIAFDVIYNRETTHGKAEFFTTTDHLLAILNNIHDEKLKELSSEMKLIANKDYTWKKISKLYANIF